MNIAVVFEGNLSDGGGYQLQLNNIVEMMKLEQYNIVAFVFSKLNKKILEEKGFKVVYHKVTVFEKMKQFLLRNELFEGITVRLKILTEFEKKICANDTDLIYFLSPSMISLDLMRNNYIFTMWDTCHRDFMEFPEVNYFREFERRERLYQKSLVKAIAVIVESPLGKTNVVKRYGVDAERVHVIPLTPAGNNIVLNNNYSILEKHGIDVPYIFYPAQFWAHKNHIYILRSIEIIIKKGYDILAVFSGSDKGNIRYLKKKAKEMKIEKNIKFLGFVPEEDIGELYKNSLALVMTTYFGPTNMPPLEAFSIGIPVVYSDLPGLKEQAGNAALFCDLKNPESLANILINLKKSNVLKSQLIANGRKRLKVFQKTVHVRILENILDNFRVKVETFKG